MAWNLFCSFVIWVFGIYHKWSHFSPNYFPSVIWYSCIIFSVLIMWLLYILCAVQCCNVLLIFYWETFMLRRAPWMGERRMTTHASWENWGRLCNVVLSLRSYYFCPSAFFSRLERSFHTRHASPGSQCSESSLPEHELDLQLAKAPNASR